MSRFTQRSDFQIVGDPAEPDVVYQNASIVNNNTDDSLAGSVPPDPPLRFNETRSAPIIKNSSDYQFSIIRFQINGANKDLPLFIPQIQSGTGQTDVNLTEQGVGLTWNGKANGNIVSIVPEITQVEYVPETQNPRLAPLPRSCANDRYVGGQSGTATYKTGDIVSDPSGSEIFQTWIATAPGNVAPPSATSWKLTDPELGRSQDLSSRQYWVQTYEHWLNCVNNAIDTANQKVWEAFNALDTTQATQDDWKKVQPSPVITQDRQSTLFSVLAPDAYGMKAVSPSSSFVTTPQNDISGAGLADGSGNMELFFNVNTEGLFTGFNNQQFNTPVHAAPQGWFQPPATPTLYKNGQTNKIYFLIEGANSNIVPAPTTGPSFWPNYTGSIWKTTQDQASTSTLWSPIDSVVFTSLLLPLQNEQVAPPNVLGTRNIGNSSATAQSAFQPVLTDISVDLINDPTGYRKMIYQAPTAEYRLSDFKNGNQEIRSIDIQVWWRNRLDNNLQPLNMFNLSSVSIKLMFRKKAVLSKSERQGLM